MKTLHNVLKNTSLLSIGQLLTKPLQFIYVAALARYVHEVGIGQITTAQAWCAMAFVFVNLGLDTLVIRDVAVDRNRAAVYLGAVTAIKLILGIIALGVLFVAMQFSEFSIQTRVIILLYSIMSLLGAFYGTIRAIYQSQERMDYDVGLQLGRDLMNIMLSLLAIYLLANLIIIVAISVLSTAIQLMVALPLLKRLKIPLLIMPKLAEMRRIFFLALPFSAIVLIMVAGGQVTTIILSLTVKQGEMGFYGAAQTIFTVLMIFPSMFSTAVFPVFSRFSVESTVKLSMAFRKSFELLLIVGFPMATLSYLSASSMMKLVFGLNFNEAIPVLRLLVLTLAGMTGFACGTYLNTTGRQTFFALSQGAFIIIQIILSLILIPRFGIIGAVVSLLIYALLGFIFYTLICYHFVRLPLPWLLSVKVLLSTMIITLIMHFFLIRNLHFVFAGLLSLFFYALLLLLLRATSLLEWRNIWCAILSREYPRVTVKL